MQNVFAVLVHERPDCVSDLVRNLRHLDPASQVVLYNGGRRTLLDKTDLFGAVVHPSPRRMEWGRLHDFALDCMRLALERFPRFDTLTIVDSDQLAVRPGWSEHLGGFLEAHPRAGLLGNSPGRQAPEGKIGPAAAAYREIELWLPWARQFPDGEEKLFLWTFWPSTVFTAAAARDLVRLFDEDAGLREILRKSRIWATEEVLLPTLVALLGYEVAASPSSYDYVQFRQEYTPAQLADALARPDVFWIHPVPRRYGDPLRRTIRERWNGYGRAAGPPLVSCIMPTRNRRELVPRAIRQFLRQDWPSAELIVVDDGCDRVADLIPADPRIRYLALDERRTIGAKRNLACEAARGEIILHWDDDDWMADRRIRAQVEHLLSSGADLSGLPSLYFHEPATGGTWQFTSPARKWVAGATFCYRKDLWRRQPFEDVDVGEDVRFLWSGRRKKVVPLADLTIYAARLHPGNTSSKRDAGRAWRPVSDRVLGALLEDEKAAAPVASVAVSRPPLVSCIMPTRERGSPAGRTRTSSSTSGMAPTPGSSSAESSCCRPAGSRGRPRDSSPKRTSPSTAGSPGPDSERVYRYILGSEEGAMATAKVFWSGNSQAIRLPKDFRFPSGTQEVEIRREGERIVLEPVQVEEWPESFWRAFEGMPEDFERPPQVRQTRESLEL